jgi:hypothetical protein
MDVYMSSGAIGFALGSTLYSPKLSMQELRERIEAYVGRFKAWT